MVKNYKVEDRIEKIKGKQLNWVLRVLRKNQDFLTDCTKAKLKSYAKDLKQSIGQNQKEKETFICRVEAIPDEKVKQVLFLHYLDGMTIKAISAALKTNTRQIVRFHGRGLSIIGK